MHLLSVAQTWGGGEKQVRLGPATVRQRLGCLGIYIQDEVSVSQSQQASRAAEFSQ